MPLTLLLHPEYRSVLRGIDVDLARDGSRLRLRYVATGPIDRIVLPPPAASAPTNKLWNHTCFEAFVRAPAGEGYGEFNFSPSTQWAAYAFTAYRSGMRALDIPAPRIETITSSERFELSAAFDVALGPAWRLGLSAVIEEQDGTKSYWALAHPPGKPDFHHADSFAYVSA